MDDPRMRNLQVQLNTLRFQLHRHGFCMQQIGAAEERLSKTLQNRNIHKQLVQVGQVQDFQVLLDDTKQRIKQQMVILQKFLDYNGDLSETNLYEQCQELLKETKEAFEKVEKDNQSCAVNQNETACPESELDSPD
ncbi:uncharacterized protein LOC115623840 [Scaptodrosophila lebanonensis]|uniref:Uncharacterized protein LOC115623840 n=1 Tax=Drosophila lebanonensis TaxID=7225 RepID=A0A6J2TE16_DROLE|nr:uncharacterized protein LOC115623840 [Scaptodrosophila lebanonensis]